MVLVGHCKVKVQHLAWGLVDYIICGDGVWDGLDSQPTGCNGLAFGDTLGLTIYQPEDVVNTDQVIKLGL